MKRCKVKHGKVKAFRRYLKANWHWSKPHILQKIVRQNTTFEYDFPISHTLFKLYLDNSYLVLEDRFFKKYLEDFDVAYNNKIDGLIND